jgi:ribosomal protein S18 acetylase RimI-like enzyme
VRIESPSTDAADAIADLWVVLAGEQREFGSRILAAENRDAIRVAVLRGVVDDGVRVARADPTDEFEAEPDAILGFVTFSVGTGVYENAIRRGKIENLFVRPAVRNEGIGSQLLDAAIDALSDRGVSEVSLEVMADNEPARRFYRRHGFSPHRVGLTRSIGSDTDSRDQQ